jgi:hypothetical protein
LLLKPGVKNIYNVNIIIFYIFVAPLLIEVIFAAIKYKYGNKIFLLFSSALLLACGVIWLIKRDIVFFHTGPLSAAGLSTHALPIASALLIACYYPNAKSKMMKIVQLLLTYALLILAVLSGYWVI